MADEFLELGNVVKKQNSLRVETPQKKAETIQSGLSALPVFDAGHEHGLKVEPIQEHGVIVGMQIQCSCGEKKKIWFQYENPTG
ncbi:MAG TPA: hypothetical protein ENJ29_12150 [Bacteroidetes bacterium]|nr:hypothetical protein [Bacteroidota bacterium]